jgi:ATP-dependent Clp protease ATP-binding subunit ClpC
MNRTIMTLMRHLRRLAFDYVSVLSPGAQAALAGARKEAQRMNHSFIGTEHLLLAIMHSESAVAVKMLKEMGISPAVVCTEIEKLVGHGPSAKVTNTFPYTPRVKKALAFAGKEAGALQHSFVGTQHMLLGLLREKEGVAGQVLENFKLEVKAIRHKVIQATPAASAEEWNQDDLG